jgi:hypothetical protein
MEWFSGVKIEKYFSELILDSFRGYLKCIAEALISLEGGKRPQSAAANWLAQPIQARLLR